MTARCSIKATNIVALRFHILLLLLLSLLPAPVFYCHSPFFSL